MKSTNSQLSSKQYPTSKPVKCGKFTHVLNGVNRKGVMRQFTHRWRCQYVVKLGRSTYSQYRQEKLRCSGSLLFEVFFNRSSFVFSRIIQIFCLVHIHFQHTKLNQYEQTDRHPCKCLRKKIIRNCMMNKTKQLLY